MSDTKTAAALNPLDAVPEEIPFDAPYGSPISLERTVAAINAVVAEASKRHWKMNVAVVDSGGNLVTFPQCSAAKRSSSRTLYSSTISIT